MPGTFVIAALLVAPATLSAEILSFGIKGGVPLTDAFQTARSGDIRYVTDTKRYLVGGAVELRLGLGLGMEFDALYKRLNYESEQGARSAGTRGNSWEFPLLFKMRAPLPGLRPYFAAGPSFRHLSGLRQFISSPLGSSETDKPGELSNRFATGFAVGVGLEIGNRFRLAPEIRYTRWGWDTFRSPVTSAFRSNPNQLDFLLGLHF